MANIVDVCKSIPRSGDFLTIKKSGDLIVVHYVEISTKNGKLDFKIYSTHGDIYDYTELY